jgi:hypothetical protein
MRWLLSLWYSKDQTSAEGKISRFVANNIARIATQRRAGIVIFDESTFDASTWNAFCQHLMDVEIKSLLTNDEIRAVYHAGLSDVAMRLIEKPARAKNLRQEAILLAKQSSTVRPEPLPRQLVLSPPDNYQSNENLRQTIAQFGFKVVSKPVGAQGMRTTSHEPIPIKKGLIIRSEPLEKILRHEKSWEMRGRSIKIRGPIALVAKGTKTVVGTANISDCIGPLTERELADNFLRHRIPLERFAQQEYKSYRFAWVLADIRRFHSPVPYIHRGGVQFVLFSDAEMALVAAASQYGST